MTLLRLTAVQHHAEITLKERRKPMQLESDKTPPEIRGHMFSPFPGLASLAGSEEEDATAPQGDHLEILLLLIVFGVLALLYVFYV